MKALSIGARLTAWYSLILALSLCLFGAIAYFAMSHSIRTTIDSGLSQRIQAVRDIIKEDAPSGLAALQDEFRELADSEGAGARLRVAYDAGALIYASSDLQFALEPRRAQNVPRPFTSRIGDARFRFLREKMEVHGARYDVEVASSTQDFDRALEDFRVVLYAATQGVPPAA